MLSMRARGTRTNSPEEESLIKGKLCKEWGRGAVEEWWTLQVHMGQGGYSHGANHEETTLTLIVCGADCPLLVCGEFSTSHGTALYFIHLLICHVALFTESHKMYQIADNILWTNRYFALSTIN